MSCFVQSIVKLPWFLTHCSCCISKRNLFKKDFTSKTGFSGDITTLKAKKKKKKKEGKICFFPNYSTCHILMKYLK